MLFSACPRTLSHLAYVPFYCMPWFLLWQRMAVNTCAAHKKTNSPATYYGAAHKVWLACSVWKWIACSIQSDSHAAYSMLHMSVEWATWQKLKNTLVFGTHKCQLTCTVFYSTILNHYHNHYHNCLEVTL